MPSYYGAEFFWEKLWGNSKQNNVGRKQEVQYELGSSKIEVFLTYF